MTLLVDSQHVALQAHIDQLVAQFEQRTEVQPPVGPSIPAGATCARERVAPRPAGLLALRDTVPVMHDEDGIQTSAS